MSISLINKERFNPSSLSNLALWLDAEATSTITVSATIGGVTSWSDRSSNRNNMMFTPTFSIPGCALWLDAADSSTIAGTTSSVTAWRDKSGNGNDMSLTAGVVSYSTNKVTFASGSGGIMTSALPTTITNGQSVVFIVCESTFVASDRISMIFACSDIFAGDYSIRLDTSTTRLFSTNDGDIGFNTAYYINGNLGAASGGIITIPSGPNVIYGLFNRSGSTRFSLSSPFTSGNVPRPFIGNIQEVIVFTSAITVTQRQQMEAYLSKKWNIPLSYSIPSAIPVFSPFPPPIISNTTTNKPSVFFPKGTQMISTRSPTTFSSKSFVAVYQCPTLASAMNVGIGSNVNSSAFGICQSNNILYSPYQYVVGDLSFGVTNYTDMKYAFASFDTSTNILSGIPGFNNLSMQVVAFENKAFITPFYIGSPGSLYTSSGFHLCEFIATSNALSSSDRQEVEAYLADKWEISLPTSHPYKNFQPSGDQWIPPTLPTTISGLALWLDTAERDTIINITGRITGWTDRSANGCNATAGGSSPPSFSPGGGILFNGTNNYFTTNLTVNSATHTLIAVHSPASASRNTSLFRFQGSEYIVFPYINNNNSRGYINSGGSTILFNNSPLVDNSVPGELNLIIADISPTAQQVYLNGNFQSSAASAIKIFTSSPLVIGSLDGTSEFYGGTLYELIVYSQYLEQSERQLLEGYLAWKWNILNKLPSSHPFSIQSPIGATVSETGALNIPAQIEGLTTWLDAADSATVSVGSGSVVTQWRDKSASLDRFTSGQAPTYSRTPVSTGAFFPGVYFLGTKSLLGTVNSGVGGTGVGTCFMVATVRTGAQVLTGGVTGGVYQLGNSFGFVSVDKTIIAPFQGTDSQYGNVVKSGTVPLSAGPTAFFARINATGNAGDGSFNFDTPVNVGTNSTLWQPYTPSSTPWVLGYTGSYPVQQDFYLHEFLCFSIYLNTTQRQVVEGYLAWKWGIQSKLPVGHPYKNARPQSA